MPCSLLLLLYVFSGAGLCVCVFSVSVWEFKKCLFSVLQCQCDKFRGKVEGSAEPNLSVEQGHLINGCYSNRDHDNHSQTALTYQKQIILGKKRWCSVCAPVKNVNRPCLECVRKRDMKTGESLQQPVTGLTSFSTLNMDGADGTVAVNITYWCEKTSSSRRWTSINPSTQSSQVSQPLIICLKITLSCHFSKRKLLFWN